MSQQRYKSNAIGHFDVAGPDIEQLGNFYTSVFGWQVDPMGPGYAMLKTPDGTPGGALVDADDPSLTIGIIVGDIDKALQVTAQSGGAIIMPKTDNGWVTKAQVSDPAGNRITLIQG